MTELSRLIAELPPDQYERLLSRVADSTRGETGDPPVIVPAPSERFEPFPLTDIQEAYWTGRTSGFELGNVATHTYMEFESAELDLERFRDALRRLVERHDMLRVVFLPDGRQQALERVPPYVIQVLDLRGVDAHLAASHLEALRQSMSHQVLPADRWPLFDIRASRFDGGRTRLHVSVDQLVCDASSYRILLRDLSRFYEDPEAAPAPPEISFRDYVLAERAFRETAVYQRASEYWRNRLQTLPPAPDLPLAKSPGAIANPRFFRQRGELASTRWQRLKARGNRAGLTPSGVLLAAFAKVLALWSASPSFTINLTLFNRLPLHPQIDEIAGEFTSLTMLEANVSPEHTFEAHARRIQQQLWNDLENRYVSGVQVGRELALARGRSQASMPVVFTSTLGQEAPSDSGLFRISGLGRTVYTISQTSQVWLDHQVAERDGALTFNWDAIAELFPPGMLEDMFQAHRRLLERLADDPATWTESTLPLLPDAQRERRMRTNATDGPRGEEVLPAMFAACARQQPRRTAVVAGAERLTYEELARRARSIAYQLGRHGVRRNDLVAVVLDKGCEQIAAVLGVVHAGAAYLPIEPAVPPERLAYLLEHGSVDVVVTSRSCDRRLQWPAAPRRLYVEDCTPRDVESDAFPDIDPDDLAYVIYTSGSTGNPKGVAIEHRAAANTLTDINERFRVGPDDAVLALSSISFDLSVYDIFGALAAGATVVVPEPARARDPRYWAELIEQERVTVWNSVPAFMELLLDDLAGRGRALPASLRLVLLSGDWIPVKLARQLRDQRPDLELVALGGATEASIWSIYYPIDVVDEQWTSIPYGRPLKNQRWHVLGRHLEPCPEWVPGELYIAGVGLAKGYWRDPEKTSASFIAHPESGERLYRTGDWGRYLPSGDIEFLGRQDLQVKIHGHRIELAEVENALGQHPSIASCVVNAVEESRGSRRLVAYMAGRSGPPTAPAELQRFLEARLPEYMVPSQYVWLTELPLTPNGKVDRKRLPVPRVEALVSAGASARADSSAVCRIGQIVAGVLHVTAVDPGANLLEMGANSVDIIRIANALDRELGFRPKIEDAYRDPTVAALVEAYERSGASIRAPAVAPAAGLLVDPDARHAFKERRLGIRPDGDATIVVRLPAADDDGTFATWRSHRTFAAEAIALGDFGRFLSCLRRIELDGEAKYLYGSAGGLYPVQVYLHVKAGRIEQIDGGTYYYNPVDHRLVALSPGATLDATIHDRFVNRPIYEHAAFSLYLIATLDAIEPMYGEQAVTFATLEAGAISQMLRMVAPDSQLGLCAIGNLNFAKIRHLFRISDRHVLLHSLLGGPVGREPGPWMPLDDARRVPSLVDEFEEGEL